jgi:hypothetical protein
MPRIEETADWSEIRKINSTNVVGGKNDIQNEQLKDLGSRTLFIKEILDKIGLALANTLNKTFDPEQPLLAQIADVKDAVDSIKEALNAKGMNLTDETKLQDIKNYIATITESTMVTNVVNNTVLLVNNSVGITWEDPELDFVRIEIVDLLLENPENDIHIIEKGVQFFLPSAGTHKYKIYPIINNSNYKGDAYILPETDYVIDYTVHIKRAWVEDSNVRAIYVEFTNAIKVQSDGIINEYNTYFNIRDQWTYNNAKLKIDTTYTPISNDPVTILRLLIVESEENFTDRFKKGMILYLKYDNDESEGTKPILQMNNGDIYTIQIAVKNNITYIDPVPLNVFQNPEDLDEIQVIFNKGIKNINMNKISFRRAENDLPAFSTIELLHPLGNDYSTVVIIKTNGSDVSINRVFVDILEEFCVDEHGYTIDDKYDLPLHKNLAVLSLMGAQVLPDATHIQLDFNKRITVPHGDSAHITLSGARENPIVSGSELLNENTSVKLLTNKKVYIGDTPKITVKTDCIHDDDNGEEDAEYVTTNTNVINNSGEYQPFEFGSWNYLALEGSIFGVFYVGFNKNWKIKKSFKPPNVVFNGSYDNVEFANDNIDAMGVAGNTYPITILNNVKVYKNEVITVDIAAGVVEDVETGLTPAFTNCLVYNGSPYWRPVRVVSISTDTTGMYITVVFDKTVSIVGTINSTTVPITGSPTVVGAVVSSGSLQADNKTLKFTMSKPIYKNNVITLSINNTVMKDIESNLATSYTSLAVTNNSTVYQPLNILSATVLNLETPNIIEIVFDKAVSLERATNIVVSGAGPNVVSGTVIASTDNKTVQLTLSYPIYISESFRLLIVTANIIKDIESNTYQVYPSVVVTNNSLLELQGGIITVTIPSDSLNFTFPLQTNTVADVYINWGDGHGVDHYTRTNTTEAIGIYHDYGFARNYNITFKGTAIRTGSEVWDCGWFFYIGWDESNAPTNKNKVIGVEVPYPRNILQNSYTTISTGSPVHNSFMAYSFYECRALKTFVPPIWNIDIGDRYLNNTYVSCDGLTTIGTIDVFGENSPSCMVGTFQYCSNLKTVTALNFHSTGTYGDGFMGDIFYECTALTKTPNITVGAQPIAVGTFFLGNAYYGCTALEEVTALPATITSIGDNFMVSAFQGCSKLKTINSNIFNFNVTSANNNFLKYTFSDCIALSGVFPKLPPLTTTGSYFMESTFPNTKITGITNGIPSTITTTGSYFMYRTFYNCKELVTTPTFPTTIGNYGSHFMDSVFTNCSKLITVQNLPNISITVGYTEAFCQNAFSNCALLNTLGRIFTTNVIKFADYLLFETFANCTSLVTLPTIPNNLRYNGTGTSAIPNAAYFMKETFKNCTKATTIAGSADDLVYNRYTITYTADTYKGCNLLTTPKALILFPTVWGGGGMTALSIASITINRAGTTDGSKVMSIKFNNVSDYWTVQNFVANFSLSNQANNFVRSITATAAGTGSDDNKKNFDITFNEPFYTGETISINIADNTLKDTNLDTFLPAITAYAVTNNSTVAKPAFTTMVIKPDSSTKQFIFPIQDNTTNNVLIYWGDGTQTTYTTAQGAGVYTGVSHTYADTANKSIRFNGTSTRTTAEKWDKGFFFDNNTTGCNTFVNKGRLLSVDNFNGVNGFTLSPYFLNHSFTGCNHLTTAPSLPPITNTAFWGTNNNAMTNIPNYFLYNTFSSCYDLTTPMALPYTTAHTIANIGHMFMCLTYSDCLNLVNPPSFLPKVTTIGNYCCNSTFENCPELTTMMPVTHANTNTIGQYFYASAYKQCPKLTTIPTTFAIFSSSLTTLPNYYLQRTFANCSKITNIAKLSSSVAYVNNYYLYETYRACYGLTTLSSAYDVSSPTLTSAGESYLSYTFAECQNLTDIYLYYVPSLNATSFAKDYFMLSTFHNCYKLVGSNIRIQSNNSVNVGNYFMSGTFYECKLFTNYQYTGVSDATTTVGSYFMLDTFANCTGFTTYLPKISPNITNLNSVYQALINTFRGCTNATNIYNTTIGNHVVTVYSNNNLTPNPQTFIGCTSLVGPLSYREIPKNWGGGKVSLTSAIVNSSGTYLDLTFDSDIFTPFEPEHITDDKYCENITLSNTFGYPYIDGMQGISYNNEIRLVYNPPITKSPYPITISIGDAGGIWSDNDRELPIVISNFVIENNSTIDPPKSTMQITLTDADKKFYFPVQRDTKFWLSVNWGDGTATETFSSENTNLNPNIVLHTYATSGVKSIQFYGIATVLSGTYINTNGFLFGAHESDLVNDMTNRGKITALNNYDGMGSIYYKDYYLYNALAYTNITTTPTAPAVFYPNSSVTLVRPYYQTFYNCTNLTTATNDWCIKSTNKSLIFQENVFRDAFGMDSKLTSVTFPSNMTIIDRYKFYCTFRMGSTSTTPLTTCHITIPKIDNLASYDFYYTFANRKDLVTSYISIGAWDGGDPIINQNYLFYMTYYKCSALANHILNFPDANIRCNANNQYLFSCTYYQCSNLTGRPCASWSFNMSYLADHCLDQTFYQCTKITNLPVCNFNNRNLELNAYVLREYCRECSAITSTNWFVAFVPYKVNRSYNLSGTFYKVPIANNLSVSLGTIVEFGPYAEYAWAAAYAYLPTSITLTFVLPKIPYFPPNFLRELTWYSKITNFSVSYVTNSATSGDTITCDNNFMSVAFAYCTNLTTGVTLFSGLNIKLDVRGSFLSSAFTESNITTSALIDVSSVFCGSNLLESYMSSTYGNCGELTTVRTLPPIDLMWTTQFGYSFFNSTFRGCSKITTVPDIMIKNFGANTSVGGLFFSNTFYGAIGITGNVILPPFISDNPNAYGCLMSIENGFCEKTFIYCNHIQSVEVKPLTNSSLTFTGIGTTSKTFNQTFYSCPALTTITGQLDNTYWLWDMYPSQFASVTTSMQTFAYCNALSYPAFLSGIPAMWK